MRKQIMLILLITFLFASILMSASDENSDDPINQKKSVQAQLKERQLPSRLEGTSKLILKKNVPPKGNIYEFPVLVDLSKVTVVIQDNQIIPCVLGAYTLGVKFDKEKVKALGVLGGKTKEFSRRPIYTNLEKANSTGLIRFSAVHTNSRTPTGKVSIARVKMEINDPKAVETVELYGDSLSTSIIFFPKGKMVGPFSIPFDGKRLPRRTIQRTTRQPVPQKKATPPSPQKKNESTEKEKNKKEDKK